MTALPNVLDATVVAAAQTESVGGSSVTDIAILATAMTTVIVLWLWLISSYRSGGAGWLRRLGDRAERLTGVPGWAALPGYGVILGALVTVTGASWDIGLHIDIGRDKGPFGTLAHYPMLVGLQWMFLMGILAIVMAPRDEERSSGASLTVAGYRAPASAWLMTAGSAFALMGFPLDDIWHRMFGQDVTLWGPTHTMFIGGAVMAGVGGILLMIEGLRVAGHDPFSGTRARLLGFGPLIAAVFLFLFTAVLHEFHWGVPQYRAIWEPYFLAIGAAGAFTMARVLCGRGAALTALLIWLPVQALIGLFSSGLWGVTPVAMPLFVAQALLVELAGIRGTGRGPVRFGLFTGVLVGTVGFAAEYGWSHVNYPLPWQPALIPEGLIVSVLAAMAAGVLGALMATALRGRLAAGRGPALATGIAAAVLLGLAFNNVVVRNPEGVTATIKVSNVHKGTVGHKDVDAVLGDVAVKLSDPALARDATWAYVLGWQGDGRVVSNLREGGDGVLRTTTPVPLDKNWKILLRVHKGRTELAASVRAPADEVLDSRGQIAPVDRAETRPMVRDTTLLQLERRKDGPDWAWKPGFLFVIGMDLSLWVLMGFICVRIGRLDGAAGDESPAEGKPSAARATRAPRATPHTV